MVAANEDEKNSDPAKLVYAKWNNFRKNYFIN